MLLLFWVLLFLAGIGLFLLMPSVLGITIHGRYRGARIVTCPVTQRHASVRIDALHAAFTGMTATEQLRLESCSLWPRRSDCAQGCLPDAIAAPKFDPRTRHAVPRAITRVPLPAYLVATVVFWLIGLFWYSPFLFRDSWMSLIGMNGAQLRYVVELWSPHFATVAIAALFTFALACVITLFDCGDAWRGMAVGALFWLIPWVVMVAVILFRGLPLGLIWLHGGYTLIASVAAGAILGVWKKDAVRGWLDREEQSRPDGLAGDS